MTSKVNAENNLGESLSAKEQRVHDANKVKRHSTVYDAVAGRISGFGFIPSVPGIASTRDTVSSSSSAVPPETVLFRRKNAPLRFEETDTYFASDLLPPHTLPESDLLKALHCYTSDFYSRVITDSRSGDWRSMDETALLALGVLMEEVCRDTLGETGDMVFTEGEELEYSSQSHHSGSDSENLATLRAQDVTKPLTTRSRKRRRLESAPP